MNLSKSKVMTNIDDDRDIKISDIVIERLDSYMVYQYVGHKLKLGLTMKRQIWNVDLVSTQVFDMFL